MDHSKTLLIPPFLGIPSTGGCQGEEGLTGGQSGVSDGGGQPPGGSNSMVTASSSTKFMASMPATAPVIAPEDEDEDEGVSEEDKDEGVKGLKGLKGDASRVLRNTFW